MGMYTTLFGEIELNPEFKSLISKYNNHTHFDWAWLRKHRGLNNHPDVKILLDDSRHTLIGYMGAAGWEDYPYSDFGETPEYELNWNNEMEPAGLEFDESSNTLKTCTSLKNYSDTYESFIRILPLIALRWNLFEIYEESRYHYAPINHVSVDNPRGKPSRLTYPYKRLTEV